jgi:Domain of unknown function (DUF1338)
MLAHVRKLLIEKLWANFATSIPNYSNLLNCQDPVLDHLAIIDLPSHYSGIPVLQKIFDALGFVQQGSGYLPDKVNDFIWMMPEDNPAKLAKASMPQVVLADFRLNLLSPNAQRILEKFTTDIAPFDFELLDQYLLKLPKSTNNIVDMVYDYINSRPQTLPTMAEYNYIKNENQLIAWALLFGRKINHFGISVHHLANVKNLQSFNQYLSKAGVELNAQGGEIKGSQSVGIEQASSFGRKLTVVLDGGKIEARDCFLEFVWRYPTKQKPSLWSDYFTGFIPYNANSVIESLYDIAS